MRSCTSRRAASSTDISQAQAPLESLLRRDRLIVSLALSALVLICWVYLVWLSFSPMMNARMGGGMDDGMPEMAADFSPWSAVHFLTMFLMWSVMMIGMMTPSAAPMILIYARVARHASARGAPFAPSTFFYLGYLFAWTGFALLATLLQCALEGALLLSPMMASSSPLFGGLLLVMAGLYQWTPLKYACLSQCQSPLVFIQRHGGFRGERKAAFSLGLRHGIYCIGCCWALMILLFVAGVMNLLWIAALGALVLAEKLIPGRVVQRGTGVALIGAGVALMIA